MTDGDEPKGLRRPSIVIVSGLPRSGTSMMMQMLEAAGLSLLTDGSRPSDPDNPRGYYEFEPVKRLESDASFLAGAVGRVVKVVAPLLPSLPPDYRYRVVFIERDLDEVLSSQREMLARLGVRPAAAEEKALAKAFEGSLRRVRDWVERQEGVRACFVSHAETVEDPGRTARSVLQFVAEDPAWSNRLTVECVREGGEDRIIQRMSSVFEDSLYRSRVARPV